MQFLHSYCGRIAARSIEEDLQGGGAEGRFERTHNGSGMVIKCGLRPTGLYSAGGDQHIVACLPGVLVRLRTQLHLLHAIASPAL